MFTFLSIVYVFVCVFLILVVLLQSGKSGGMGSAFGGGGSNTVFGGAGAGNFLTRLTAISAALFMILSATLAYLSSNSEKSLERASETLRKREEALSGSVGKKGKPAGAAKPAPMSAPDSPAPADKDPE